MMLWLRVFFFSVNFDVSRSVVIIVHCQDSTNFIISFLLDLTSISNFLLCLFLLTVNQINISVSLPEVVNY